MLDQGFYEAEAAGLLTLPEVRHVLRTNRLADVAHAPVHGVVSYFYSHSALVAAITRARGIPAVATGGCEQLLHHRGEAAWRYYARLGAFQGCAAGMRRILATSTEDCDRMRRKALVGRDRIKLSFHGVAAVEGANPGVLSLSRSCGSMVTIAGLDTPLNVRRKGVPDAVALLARVSRTYADACLTIIGRTTCRAMVAEHARQLGVADRLHFAGYVEEEEKIALLQRSRFYVQLSEYEGFGIGALEALAHGCQVIHSNVGGLRDTIGDYGVVLRPGDIDRFEVDAIPRYEIADWPKFEEHLRQFAVSVRARTIIDALGLQQVAR